MKYFLSSTIILSIIFIMNMLTGLNTNNKVEILENKYFELRDGMGYAYSNNLDLLDNLLKDTEETWKEANKTLALYIEHEELDKAEMEMVTLKANIDIKDYDEAIKSIDKIVFQLNHIKEKNKLKLKNIF